ncbi:hypothetical protein LTR99_007690 [Exophiala xenobiotica]|nr:hypothetical protein LTR92_001228 [Exophiala xenobiotica]KAK5298001.1 hypothetical protein LTR99_007690 [Exophiala xenobiotica]KAK5428929.1 hypothetical protein LTR34_007388 [Exophiala xenobiotica]KAK5560126.1 hypothetical protein LTR46_001876 [Exophiala xenobiotica]
MAASTTSAQVGEASHSRRRRRGWLEGWRTPDVPFSTPDVGPISNRSGPTLTSESLIKIAEAFIRSDLILLRYCEKLAEYPVLDRFGTIDEARDREAKTLLRDVAVIMEDYDPIRGQQFQFHKDVLKNKILEEHASKSLAILAQGFGDPNIGWEVADLMRRINLNKSYPGTPSQPKLTGVSLL